MDMETRTLLDSSCRVAFSAYLHDLGKFEERARLGVDPDRLHTHEQMYCPRHESGGGPGIPISTPPIPLLLGT